MRNVILIAVILTALGASAEGIKGCTSDIRTGVCNSKCSVSHLAGCTPGQLKPLLLVQHLDCLNKRFDEGEAGRNACKQQFDKAAQEWKDAQPKKSSSK